jgi:phage terminase large subunit
VEIQIHKKYQPLLHKPKGVRYYIVTGGRGSGKSFAVGLWATIQTTFPDVKILYTRFTLISAKKSIIPEFEEKIDMLGYRSLFDINNYDISNKQSGSEILFSGIKTSSGNQTANLKSLQGVSCWILEEAEEEDNEDRFDKIDLSIRSQKSQNIVVLILNPTTKEHWIYKRFFEDAGVAPGFNGIKGDTCYIHTTYQDNIQNLSDTYLKRIDAIRENNPSKYKHQIL